MCRPSAACGVPHPSRAKFSEMSATRALVERSAGGGAGPPAVRSPALGGAMEIPPERRPPTRAGPGGWDAPDRDARAQGRGRRERRRARVQRDLVEAWKVRRPDDTNQPEGTVGQDESDRTA